MNEWFLIPKEVTKKIQAYLVAQNAKELLHDFETSLHITKCVPNDFKE